MPDVPATAWETLYRFEDYIEAAAKTILTARNVTTVYIQQDTTDLVTPRASLQFVVGGAIEHYGMRASDGQMFVDRWQGRLTVEVATARNVNKSSHSAIRSKVRQYLGQWGLFRTDALLPYHDIARVFEGPSSPIIRTEEDEDVSQISFEIIFGIRSGAWPTSANPAT